MKKLLTGLLAVALLCTTGLATPAFATDVINTTADNYSPNLHFYCVTNATAGYTNATTTPSDITGASCAVPAFNGDFAKSFIRTCFWADATKSTATTGAIGVYVNGALVTASKRFIASAAGQGTISGCYTVARSDGSAQTVKLQGVSGDTNTFTVSQLVLEVTALRTLK
jgi:hypothetical protein